MKRNKPNFSLEQDWLDASQATPDRELSRFPNHGVNAELKSSLEAEAAELYRKQDQELQSLDADTRSKGPLGWLFREVEEMRDRQNELAKQIHLQENQSFCAVTCTRHLNQSFFGDGIKAIPFDEQTGPAQGARLRPDGKITLLSHGLWKASSLLTADEFLITSFNELQSRFNYRILVRDQNGTPYHQKELLVGNRGFPVSGFVETWFVVPEPGYTVEAEIQYLAAGRGLLPGTGKNHLSVHKIHDDPGDKLSHNV